MDFEEFRHHVGDLAKAALKENGHETTIDYIEANGSNGTYPALVVKVVAESSSTIQLGASFHMDEIYDDYINGKVDIDQIVEHIVDASTMNVPSYVKDFKDRASDMLNDYESTKNKLFVRASYVENAENSIKVDSPYKQFEDVVISYHILINADSQGVTSVRVSNEMLSSFGITAEELHRDAMANHEKLFPTKVQSMVDIMREMGAPEEMIAMAAEREVMFPIVNDQKAFAAAAMFMPEAMAKVAERLGESFYILPSSINELIAIPESASEGRDVNDLNEMIADVNERELSQKELLSYNAFHYDADAKKLELATKYVERVKQQDAPNKGIDPRA